MSFDEVITLTADEASLIGDTLTSAALRHVRVRVAIDDGGVKIAAGRDAWTPPIGTDMDRDDRGPFFVTVTTDPPKPPYGSPERAEYDDTERNNDGNRSA